MKKELITQIKDKIKIIESEVLHLKKLLFVLDEEFSDSKKGTDYTSVFQPTIDLINSESVSKNNVLFIDLICHHYPLKEFLLDKYINKLNWKLLSKNESLPWSIEFIKKYSYWFWRDLEKNKSLPWTIPADPVSPIPA